MSAIAALAAAALVAAALVLATPGDAALRLAYRLEQPGAGSAETVARVMRERLAAAGIRDTRVSVSARGILTISAPRDARREVAALARQGRFGVHWERSLLGEVPMLEAEARALPAGRPGGRAVRGEGSAPASWFALAGAPALTSADIASAEAGLDEVLRQPMVAVRFTPAGQAAFEALTRRLAHRGSAKAGADPAAARQHFALVLDDRIYTLPWIDFLAVPDGMDGSTGVQIVGDLTPVTARRLAAILSSGPLPARLVPA